MTFNNTFGDMTVHRITVLVIAALLALLAVRVIGGGRKKFMYAGSFCGIFHGGRV